MAVQEHTGWERKNSMNKIAILDAATQSVQYQDDDGTEYGRGLAVKLLKQYMADNVFVITPGLLTGTPVPCATRATIVGKSKEEWEICVSNISGDFPQKLASMHLSGIVIKGSCKDKNTIIHIEEQKISFLDFPELQGKSCKEMVSCIREKWGRECAIIGRGPASDHYYPISSLFVTYPYGKPEYSCPRSSTGAGLAKIGIRAIVLERNQYFRGACENREGLQSSGKRLAKYILDDPICGGALPGLGSITLLHLLKNEKNLEELLQEKRKEEKAEIEKSGERINYCCAPMCVIGCLNRHSKGNGNIYSSPEESEIKAAIEQCFAQDMEKEQLESCTTYLSQKGMESGLNMIELVFAMRLYFDAEKEKPSLEQILQLVREVEAATVLGRVLAGGTRRVCEVFSDETQIQGRATKKAVTKERDYQLKIDLELLYREIFLFENLGICIFSSFALLNKEEPLRLLSELYKDKTGREITVEEMLQYSAQCLKQEEELWKELNIGNNIKAIPEFIKVLYNYFENTKN